MKRKTRLRPVSPKRQERSGKPGKTGIVRVYGPDYKLLRIACFARDKGRCRKCGTVVEFNPWNSLEKAFEMAHIHAKRNGGDTLDNVISLCSACHRAQHNGKWNIIEEFGKQLEGSAARGTETTSGKW